MLYYHDGPQGVWRKPLTALEKKSYSYSKVLEKILSKGVGGVKILNKIMTKEVYFDILKKLTYRQH